jgi:geranylgeranyl pyrophosphate synthase
MTLNHKSENIILKRLNEIGLSIHSKYIDKIYQSVNEPELISIFQHIESYWFDRDRSALIWLCNEIVGGTPENTIFPSLIMSLTSSGIGVHDDIIDKTTHKHNAVTVPGKFGVKKSLVVGDLLIIKGLLNVDTLYSNFDMTTSNLLVKVFYDYFSEMATSEILEINSNKHLEQDLQTYHKMLWKLGVDGEACARLGAVSGNATKEELEALAFFGRSLGYILRLREEIIDISNKRGNLKNRIENESIPLALLYISKQSVNNYQQVKEILDKEKINDKDVSNVVKICYEPQTIDYINKNIDESFEKAVTSLDIFPDSTPKSMLIKILELKRNQSSLM